MEDYLDSSSIGGPVGRALLVKNRADAVGCLRMAESVHCDFSLQQVGACCQLPFKDGLSETHCRPPGETWAAFLLYLLNGFARRPPFPIKVARLYRLHVLFSASPEVASEASQDLFSSGRVSGFAFNATQSEAAE